MALIWFCTIIAVRAEGLQFPPPVPPQTPETLVATVGGSPISAFALRKALLQRGAEIDNRFDSLEAKNTVLRELIRREVLAQAARDAGYEQDPEVQETVSRVLADRYLGEMRQLNPAPPLVSADDIQAYYAAHQADFALPGRSRASIIFLKSPPGNVSEAQADLRRRAEQLEALATGVEPAEFAKLAQRHSNDSTSRRRGGDIGWFVEGAIDYRWPKPVLQALFAIAEPGTLAPLVDTPKGIYIVRLSDRRPATTRPLQEVEATIRTRLTEQRRTQQIESWITKLAERYPVETHQEVLRSIATDVADTDTLGLPPSFPAGTSADHGQGGKATDQTTDESRKSTP